MHPDPMKAYTLFNDFIRHIDISKVKLNKLTYLRLINPSLDDLQKVAEITKVPFAEFKESLEEDERPKLKISRYLELIYSAPVVEEGEHAAFAPPEPWFPQAGHGLGLVSAHMS